MRQQFGVIAQQFVGAQQQFGEVDEAAALADFFVATGTRRSSGAIRIAVVVKMLRPQALVFLRVDEPLNFLGYPAAVIDLQVLAAGA